MEGKKKIKLLEDAIEKYSQLLLVEKDFVKQYQKANGKDE